MKLTTLLFTGLVLLTPLAAQATSYQTLVQEHASRQNLPVPEVVEYRYGMKLDVARVVFKTPLDKSCQVTPRLMIYKDSKGDLNAVQYRTMSECRGNS
ncbi:DUF2790 domain-containing protein [Pseudomonas sp. 3A(2025)]